MTRFLIATAALAAVSVPAAAASDARSVPVSVSDLDLNSPAGRARLKTRVGHAADKVCGAGDARGTAAHRAFRECRAAAIRDALGQ